VFATNTSISINFCVAVLYITNMKGGDQLSSSSSMLTSKGSVL